MVRIRVRVPEDRARAGLVEIADGFRTLVEDTAVATSGIVSASDRVSGGHPPFGHYALAARAPTPADARVEYGDALLLFEPVAGEALRAESYGRFGVLVYAGPAGRDELLRRTQGGVRLSSRAMRVLLEHLDDEREVELAIEPLTPAPWWAFWRKSATPPALSRDPPRFTEPPHDEATLARELARMTLPPERRRRRAAETDDDRFNDRESPARASRGDGSELRGGGGSGGGGGASGAWSDAPAPGRGPGVTAAGVVVAAAGAAALAAAAAERDSRSGGDAPADGTSSDAQSAPAAAESRSSGSSDASPEGASSDAQSAPAAAESQSSGSGNASRESASSDAQSAAAAAESQSSGSGDASPESASSASEPAAEDSSSQSDTAY